MVCWTTLIVYSRSLSHTTCKYNDDRCQMFHVYMFGPPHFHFSSPLLHAYVIVGIRSAQFEIEWSCRRMHILIGFWECEFVEFFYINGWELCVGSVIWNPILSWWICLKTMIFVCNFRANYEFLWVNLATLATIIVLGLEQKN